jgi:4a-hydroxytetrahydrobiopterin dehydratase
MSKRLDAAEIAQRLGERAEWTRRDDAIERTFEFKDFAAAMRFVDGVAEQAEAADHHPDIDIRYNRVRLSLSTHSAGGLTGKDFALAARIDELPRV